MKKIQNIIAVNDEMVTVKKANTARKKMTAKQLKEYLKNVEPFQQDGRWGLKVMNDIIVKPIYAHISNFRGDYAQCRIGTYRNVCMDYWTGGVISSCLRNINTYTGGMNMRLK